MQHRTVNAALSNACPPYPRPNTVTGPLPLAHNTPCCSQPLLSNTSPTGSHPALLPALTSTLLPASAPIVAPKNMRPQHCPQQQEVPPLTLCRPHTRSCSTSVALQGRAPEGGCCRGANGVRGGGGRRSTHRVRDLSCKTAHGLQGCMFHPVHTAHLATSAVTPNVLHCYSCTAVLLYCCAAVLLYCTSTSPVPQAVLPVDRVLRDEAQACTHILRLPLRLSVVL